MGNLDSEWAKYNTIWEPGSKGLFFKGAASMRVPPHAHFVSHLNDLDLGLDIHGRTEYFNGWGTIFICN